MVLIYFEGFRSKNDAQEREKKLKHHARGVQEIYKRCKNSLL
jgi:predicted GIY-YIG superfamily endonuclease